MSITVRDNKSLNEAIAFLENQQKSEAYLLKEHFEFTKQELNPVNIVKDKIQDVKDKFHDAIASPSLKGKLLKGAVGLASGFLAKRFLLGSGGGIVSKIAGTALQTGVSSLLMKAPDTIDEMNIGNINIGNIKDDGISMLQKGLGKLKIK